MTRSFQGLEIKRLVRINTPSIMTYVEESRPRIPQKNCHIYLPFQDPSQKQTRSQVSVDYMWQWIGRELKKPPVSL